MLERFKEVTNNNYKQVVKEIFGNSEIPTEKFITHYAGEADGFKHYDFPWFNKALTKDYRCFYEVFQDVYYCASLKGKTTKAKVIVTSVNAVPKYSSYLEYVEAIKNQVTKKWIICCIKDKVETFLIFNENIDSELKS
jgi:hypothetical protein